MSTVAGGRGDDGDAGVARRGHTVGRALAAWSVVALLLPALQAVVLASSVMYLRLLALIALISPEFALVLWWKLGLLFAAGLVIALLARPRNGASRRSSTPATT